MNRIERVCLIGFGEVGQILADDLAALATLVAWDLKFPDRDSLPSRALQGRNVRGATNAARACSVASSTVSLAPAGYALPRPCRLAPVHDLKMDHAEPCSVRHGIGATYRIQFVQ